MQVVRRGTAKGLGLLLGLLLSGSALAVAAIAPTPGDHPSPPDGLSTADWAQISAQIRTRQYEAQPGADGSFIAANPAHGWGIVHQIDGRTVLRPRADGDIAAATDYQIALRVQALGYGDASEELAQPTALGVDRERVTYQWNHDLREWWINNAQGVEQWFEVAAPPLRDDGQHAAEPLTLAMALETGLQATIQDNALQLHSADGQTRIRYAGLTAWDADGAVLPATMQLKGGQLVLRVDDRAAHYPITIDPNFAQQAYLKAPVAGAGGQFGQAVAVSGDTAVVGASGVAYVFVRSGVSWS